MGNIIYHRPLLMKYFKAKQTILRLTGSHMRIGYQSSYWLLEVRVPGCQAETSKCWPSVLLGSLLLHHHGSRSLLLASTMSPWWLGIEVWLSEIIILIP